MRPSALLLAAALLAAPFLAEPAHSQQAPSFPQVRVGQTVQGVLSSDDPALTRSGPFRVYRLDAEAGERYLVDLRSDDFDAYLTVARTVHGITDFMREDDDGGEGTNARLRFTARESGPHFLIAQAFGGGGTGRYALTVARGEAPRAAEPRPIELGGRVSAWLSEGDPLYVTAGESEVYHHLYRLEGEAGQALEITMDSEDFDAYLEFGPLRGGEIEVTDLDDDGGDGTNARLRVRLPARGTYGVRARSYGDLQTGGYTLRVRPWTPRAAVTRAVRAGQEVSGELSGDDAELEDGSYYHLWTYEGRAGERLTVRMRSDAFDTFLAVGRMHGDVFDELAANDDAPDDGTNSLVELTLPAAGTYTIRASSLFGGRTGPYTLHVESGR